MSIRRWKAWAAFLHSEELIESKRGDDSGLWNVCNSHGDLVVASDQIDLRENPHTSYLGREILYVRHRVPVRYGDVVEASVISARAPSS